VSETYNPAQNRFVNRRGARNEPLDTWVYAFAAAHHPELRLHRATKADWDRLETLLLNQVAPGVYEAPEVKPAPATQPAPRPVIQRPSHNRNPSRPTW
jgi:phage terminase large subunit GpA-like protein